MEIEQGRICALSAGSDTAELSLPSPERVSEILGFGLGS